MPIDGSVYILTDADARRLLRSLAQASETVWEVLASRKLRLSIDDDGEAELLSPRTYDLPDLDHIF